MSSTKLS